MAQAQKYLYFYLEYFHPPASSFCGIGMQNPFLLGNIDAGETNLSESEWVGLPKKSRG